MRAVVDCEMEKTRLAITRRAVPYNYGRIAAEVALAATALALIFTAAALAVAVGMQVAGVMVATALMLRSWLNINVWKIPQTILAVLIICMFVGLWNQMDHQEHQKLQQKSERHPLLERVYRLAPLLHVVDCVFSLLDELLKAFLKNQLLRSVWEPGESIYQKLVKTSGDVHANPGPTLKNNNQIRTDPENVGVKELRVKNLDPKSYAALGLTPDGKYKFEINGKYICMAQTCGAKQKDRTWKDYPSFKVHGNQFHRIQLEDRHRWDKLLVTVEVFNDSQKIKCDCCEMTFFSKQQQKTHMKKCPKVKNQVQGTTRSASNSSSQVPNPFPPVPSSSTPPLQQLSATEEAIVKCDKDIEVIRLTRLLVEAKRKNLTFHLPAELAENPEALLRLEQVTEKKRQRLKEDNEMRKKGEEASKSQAQSSSPVSRGTKRKSTSAPEELIADGGQHDSRQDVSQSAGASVEKNQESSSPNRHNEERDILDTAVLEAGIINNLIGAEHRLAEFAQTTSRTNSTNTAHLLHYQREGSQDHGTAGPPMPAPDRIDNFNWQPTGDISETPDSPPPQRSREIPFSSY